MRILASKSRGGNFLDFFFFKRLNSEEQGSDSEE